MLTKKQKERTKKLSIVDGAGFNVMYGFGEQYVPAYAIKLGATASEVGILSTIPTFIGNISQVIGAKLTSKCTSRKKLVLMFVAMQALILLPLFIVPFFTKSILLLTVFFSLYFVFSNIAAPAWNSWIGDIVEEDERAKYFAKRNKIVIAAMVASILAAGLFLNRMSNVNIWVGFAALFLVAFIGRVVSFIALARHYEPSFERYDSGISFMGFLKTMDQTNFGWFVIFRSTFAFAVMIASPFFAVYMLSHLNFSYVQYMVIILTSLVFKVLTMMYWGRYAKRFGNRNIMYVSAIPAAFVPFGWLIAGIFFEGSPLIFFIIMATEAISGFGWAGFELANFNYMLETSKPEERAKLFAYFNVVFGTCVLIGGLLGSFILKSGVTFFTLKAIFVAFLLSGIARFMIIGRFLDRIKEVKIEKKVDERKLFYDLVLNNPADNAVHHLNGAMTFVEEKVIEGTKKTIEIVAKPIEPVIDVVEKGLEKAEVVKKKMIPHKVRKHRKKFKKDLVNNFHR